jgi:FMN phosphatase YigB (HAD superfamily)
VYESGLQNRFEHGRISTAGFLETLVASLENPKPVSDPRLLTDALSDMFQPIESMTAAIDQLRNSGTRMGILSNTCDAHWNWILRQQHPMMSGPFDAIVLSFEVNAMKPDDQIYRAAELSAGVPSDQILFLDDKAENVRAAKQRGWQAEQCLGGDSAIGVLKRHGLGA